MDVIQKNEGVKTAMNKLNSIDTKFGFFRMELLAGESNYMVEHVGFGVLRKLPGPIYLGRAEALSVPPMIQRDLTGITIFAQPSQSSHPSPPLGYTHHSSVTMVRLVAQSALQSFSLPLGPSIRSVNGGHVGKVV